MKDTDAIYEQLHATLPEGRWIEDLWAIDSTLVAVFGENLLHVKGFFADLVTVAHAYGDAALYLLDVEAERRMIEFALNDSEEEYMRKQRRAPELGPGWGFPFGLCRQALIGNGSWVLLSDRDAERMCFLSRKMPTAEQLASVWHMLRSS